MVKEQLEHRIIRKLYSMFGVPVILVCKKDGTTRFCVDYRKLNENISTDAYPLPCIDNCLDALGNAQFFSTLDLATGF